MDKSSRNAYLGTAMFLEHVGEVCPGVIEKANTVARKDGTEIPVDVELTTDDRREIVKACALTVLLGQQRVPTELERLTMLHVVNGAVERDFLPVPEAFHVMYELTELKPRNELEWTMDSWQSSLDSMVNFQWPVIERQLAELREKAGRIVSGASDYMQHKLADSRYYWERILQRHWELVDEATKPTFDNALIIYKAVADVAWQYKIEIATARALF